MFLLWKKSKLDNNGLVFEKENDSICKLAIFFVKTSFLIPKQLTRVEKRTLVCVIIAFKLNNVHSKSVTLQVATVSNSLFCLGDQNFISYMRVCIKETRRASLILYYYRGLLY